MTKAITAATIIGTNPLMSIVPDNPALRSRMDNYCRWLERVGRKWYEPDLAGWRDYLFDNDLSPHSVAAYLSTVRNALGRLIRNNEVRAALFDLVPGEPERKKALVDELITRIENAIEPSSAPVSLTKKQDRADSEHVRLTKVQADALLAAPGTKTLKGLRDTALIAVLLCTGIREGELAKLEVEDLRQKLGGELSLWIRHGKGNKARLVPWGELNWALLIIDAWLRRAGITKGPVFRGMMKGGKVKHEAISTRSIQLVLAEYPLVIDGKYVWVKPHDCRRTYARRLYEAGVDLLAIQQNLGHSDHKTTLHYVGVLDAEVRRPPALYDFDMRTLAE